MAAKKSQAQRFNDFSVKDVIVDAIWDQIVDDCDASSIDVRRALEHLNPPIETVGIVDVWNDHSYTLTTADRRVLIKYLNANVPDSFDLTRTNGCCGIGEVSGAEEFLEEHAAATLREIDLGAADERFGMVFLTDVDSPRIRAIIRKDRAWKLVGRAINPKTKNTIVIYLKVYHKVPKGAK